MHLGNGQPGPEQPQLHLSGATSRRTSNDAVTLETSDGCNAIIAILHEQRRKAMAHHTRHDVRKCELQPYTLALAHLLSCAAVTTKTHLLKPIRSPRSPAHDPQATVRSTVQIKNKSDISLEARALSSAWPADFLGERGKSQATPLASSSPSTSQPETQKGSLPLGVIHPGCVLDVPVKMAYASHVQLRPAAEETVLRSGLPPREGGMLGGYDDVYAWSAPVPLLVNHVDTARDDWLACDVLAGGSGAGVASSAVRLVAHAETTEEGCATLTVVPPVTVVNALPCPFRCGGMYCMYELRYVYV